MPALRNHIHPPSPHLGMVATVDGEELTAVRWTPVIEFAAESIQRKADRGQLGSRTCRRCGRLLTSPQAIRAGIGPICAAKESAGKPRQAIAQDTPTFEKYDRVVITGDGFSRRVGTIVDEVDDLEEDRPLSYYVEIDFDDDDWALEDLPNASDRTFLIRATNLTKLTGGEV